MTWTAIMRGSVSGSLSVRGGGGVPASVGDATPRKSRREKVQLLAQRSPCLLFVAPSTQAIAGSRLVAGPQESAMAAIALRDGQSPALT